jgi:hypothetical protein
MTEIEFITDSFLRQQLKPLDQQPGSDIRTVGKGLVLKVEGYRFVSKAFIQIVLKHPFSGWNTWLIYAPDVLISNGKSQAS